MAAGWRGGLFKLTATTLLGFDKGSRFVISSRYLKSDEPSYKSKTKS